MSPTRKWLSILVVLVGVGLIVERTASMAGDESAAAEPVLRARQDRGASVALEGRRAAASAASPAQIQLDRLEARQRTLDGADDRSLSRAAQSPLFASVSWPPPAPARAPVRAPPKPVAPAFPYAYVGSLLDEGVRTVFFSKGDRVLAIKAGDTVDAAYRVEQMNDKQMQLTYLPLDQGLTVALGAGR